VARRERRDGAGDRDGYRDRDRERGPDQEPIEPERDSVTALKTILTKVAGVVKPLGMNAEESTDLVQRMYETALELDTRLAGEPDDRRKSMILDHIRGADIRREDEVLVVDYSAGHSPAAGTDQS
jgi:hypothetical protein